MFNRLIIITLLCFMTYNSSLYPIASTTATITYSVEGFDSILLSGDPGPLNIASLPAGCRSACISDSSTTYAISTNSNRIITGTLLEEMPYGLFLSVNLMAPRGATTAGDVPLSTAPALLVSGISKISESGLIITYTLEATAEAEPTKGTNIVTYTIGPQ